MTYELTLFLVSWRRVESNPPHCQLPTQTWFLLLMTKQVFVLLWFERERERERERALIGLNGFRSWEGNIEIEERLYMFSWNFQPPPPNAMNILKSKSYSPKLKALTIPSSMIGPTMRSPWSLMLWLMSSLFS